MKATKLIIAFCLMAALASCKSSKENLTYFSNLPAESNSGTVESGKYEITIIPDDELVITITSLTPEATAPYNAPLTAISNRAEKQTVTQQQSLQTYVVDHDGFINMPIIGKIKAQGLTTTQLRDQIATKVAENVIEPYVRVQLLNYRVNVLGEVKTPGAITVVKERYSILDAIAEAGDLTPYGRRENVLLIREENGQRIYHRLNLNDAALLSSPYFYLRQNDVVYVEPNEVLKSNSRYSQDNGYKLSVISTIVSAASVIASLAIALIAK